MHWLQINCTHIRNRCEMQGFLMRKRILALGLCVVLALSATACGKDKDKTARSGNVGTVANNKADMTGTDYSSKVKLPEYKGLKVGESTVNIEDATKKKINCLLISSGYFTVDTSAVEKQEGTVGEFDIVNIDYVGKIDGAEFEGGSAKDSLLGIGTGSFIDGFEDGLKGVKTGQTVELSLKFPEDYTNKDYAGKDVVFTVTVNYIVGITDDFVAANTDEIYYFLHEYFLNGKYVKTKDEYNDAITEGIKVSNIASKIVSTITEAATTEVDDAELTKYLDGIKAPIKEVAETNGMDFATVISYYYGLSSEEEFDEYYTNIFKNYLVLIKIAKEEGIKVTSDEYNTVAQSMVDHSKDKYADIAAYQADYAKQSTVDDLICGKVYYKLADYVKVVPDDEIETTTEETTTAAK